MWQWLRELLRQRRGGDAAQAMAPPRRNMIRAPHGDRATEDDKDKSYAAGWEALMAYVDGQLLMNKLAAEYCAFQFFWLHFFPLQIIVAISSTLALCAASETSWVDSGTAAHLSLASGILGFVIAFISALDRYTDFRARTEKHQAAVRTFNKIKSILILNSVQKATENSTPLPLDELHKKCEDIKDSDVAVIPPAIEEAFEHLTTHVLAEFEAQQIDINSEKTNRFLCLVHRKLVAVITESAWWPLRLPNSKVVAVAHARVKQMLDHEGAIAYAV